MKFDPRGNRIELDETDLTVRVSLHALDERHATYRGSGWAVVIPRADYDSQNRPPYVVFVVPRNPEEP